MGSIINNLQSIAICNLFDSANIARFTIAMHWHDCSSLWSDCCLYLLRIKVAGLRVNIYKYRFAASPPDGVCCSYKRVRCGNNLTRDAHCLKSCEQRQGTIGKKTDVRNLEISSKIL